MKTKRGLDALGEMYAQEETKEANEMLKAQMEGLRLRYEERQNRMNRVRQTLNLLATLEEIETRAVR